MNTQQKQLAGLFCLDHNVKLYIPSTIHGDKATDNTPYITRALVLFSDLFGGATSYDAAGAWNSAKLGLIVENVKIVESYATKEQIQKGLADVIKYAGTLKNELSQESIAIEYDNKLYLL